MRNRPFIFEIFHEAEAGIEQVFGKFCVELYDGFGSVLLRQIPSVLFVERTLGFVVQVLKFVDFILRIQKYCWIVIEDLKKIAWSETTESLHAECACQIFIRRKQVLTTLGPMSIRTNAAVILFDS